MAWKFSAKLEQFESSSEIEPSAPDLELNPGLSDFTEGWIQSPTPRLGLAVFSGYLSFR